MPTSLIPIIARTNTIDEWRIQTNKSATDLNDLGFYTYDKAQGTLLLSGTSLLSITAEGTPLQVANNVLFQSSLTLGNTLFLGIQSSATGNIIAGGTISVRGPGQSLNVANSVYVGRDLQIVQNVYTSNVIVNTDITIANNLTVTTGKLRLNGSGNVSYINTGSSFTKTLYSDQVYSTNVSTANLYALYAKVDVLDDLSFARIITLDNTTTNSHILKTNAATSNFLTTKNLIANVTANIVNLESNVAVINVATIVNGNVLTLVSNNSTINVSTVNTSTILTGNVVSLVSNNSILNNSTVNTSTVLVGNVVTLTSNSSTINVASINLASINTLTTWNITSTNRITGNSIVTNNIVSSTINTSILNVTSNLWMSTGSLTRIFAPNDQHESLTVDGKTTLRTALITSNLTVEGTWTALGDIEYEVGEIILNKRTPTNAEATFRNERPIGDDALIRWNEADDRWTISRGNTYSSLYGILDDSFLSSSINSTSTSNVATSLAVNTAHFVAQTSGMYANSAFAAQNTTGSYANSAYAQANLAFTAGGVIAGSYANSAYHTANSGSSYANSAFTHANSSFIQANTPSHVANSAALYANGAFLRANTPTHVANSASLYANAAFSKANTVATDLNDVAISTATAVHTSSSASLYANGAFAKANNSSDAVALDKATSGSAYANSAFAAANNAVQKVAPTQTITGDLTITRRLNTANLQFDGDSARYFGSNFVFNSDLNPNTSPGENAAIQVYRGTNASPATFQWNETLDKWQFEDGVNGLHNLEEFANKANNITGGATNKIPYQTNTSATQFIDAPAVANRFLKWTGTEFTWADVPAADLNNLNATNLTSGTVPSGRLTGTYSININGTASSACTATTASSATSATNATNVIDGGTVHTNTIRCDDFANFYSNVFFRSGGTTTSRTDPSNLAALKVTGDVAVSNEVWALQFQGVAVRALYADLAEKYLSDKKYPTGTIMMVGGKKEVTAAKDTKKHAIIGIVSEKPAYVMNNDLKNGLIVGLKGRLPVRIIGTCEKGDLITVSEKSGVGISIKENVILPFRIIALENKETEEEGLIEVVIM
jgi:hypothetical protein